MSEAFDEKLRREAAPPPTAAGPPGGQFTSVPELAALSREQVRDLFTLVNQVAMAITRSEARADELVQTTFEKLMTTRRWDGEKSLEAHVVGVMKSLVYNQHRSERARSDDGTDRKSRAHDGFYREIAGQESASPEQRVIEQTDDDDRQKSAASELDELAARVADHPLAGRVLQKRLDGMRKPAEIASALGVSPDEVYRANDVLRRNLRALRRNRGQGGHDEGEEE